MKIIISRLEGLTTVESNMRSELRGHLRTHHLCVKLMNYIDPGVKFFMASKDAAVLLKL